MIVDECRHITACKTNDSGFLLVSESMQKTTSGVELGAPKICVFEILESTEMRNFNLELNATKNIDYIKKCFKQKLHRIKFATKNSMDAYLYLSLE